MQQDLTEILVAVLLFVIQIGFGAITGHHTAEGTSFFGIPIGHILPYAVTRTRHLQPTVSHRLFLMIIYRSTTPSE
jgi:nitric oxide reductase large subunit